MLFRSLLCNRANEAPHHTERVTEVRKGGARRQPLEHHQAFQQRVFGQRPLMDVNSERLAFLAGAAVLTEAFYVPAAMICAAPSLFQGALKGKSFCL